MGNFCATDIYKEIKESYPQDFQKYIIGQEMKKTLKDRVVSAEVKITASSRQIKQQNIKAINSSEKQVEDHYEIVKSQVDKFYLGGTRGLQQANNSTVDQIFGYPAIKDKFQGLRKDMNTKFTQCEQNFRNQLNLLARLEEEKITKEQPKLEMFEQLPDKVKNEVYKSGLKEYKQKIEEQSRIYLAPLEKRLAVYNHAQICKDLLPREDLKTLNQQSKQSFDRQLPLFIGNPSQIHAFLQ